MNKRILITLVSIVCTLYCSAQFDEKFYQPSKKWNPIEGISFTEINFTIDNDTINTVLFSAKKQAKATVFYYHGNSGNISNNSAIAKLLCRADYQVLMVDYRGYGKSTGIPKHSNIASDAQYIFDELLKRDNFKELPVIIYGASIGTQVATKICIDNQKRVNALILDGAMSSFTDMALLSAPEEQKAIITQYVTSPYSAKENVKHLSSTPKLFIHSPHDRAVPYKQSKYVYDNASAPKEQWIYEGEHLEAPSKYPQLFIEKINKLYHSSTL